MDILVITHFLNGFLMVAMPLGLGIFLTRKFKLGWGLFGIGAVTFILSQVGHIPFNLVITRLLNQSDIVYWHPVAQTVFNAIFLGLSAGIFEETARYLVLRFWARDARSWRKAILFGAGHGGAEAIILGALVIFSYFAMLAYRGVDPGQIVPADQLELARQQMSTYWSATWYDTLLGALERLFTIPCQIFMAVLVMQVFTRRNIFWLLAAIGYHALLDGVSVLGVTYLGVYWTEAMIGFFAILSVAMIYILRQPEPQTDPEPVPIPTPKEILALAPVDESEENLENTRYQ